MGKVEQQHESPSICFSQANYSFVLKSNVTFRTSKFCYLDGLANDPLTNKYTSPYNIPSMSNQ